MSKPIGVDVSGALGQVVLPRRLSMSALWALFQLSGSRMIRGRKLLTLCLLLVLPTALVLFIQRYSPRYDPRVIEMAFILAIFPQALVPLTALVYGSGMVQDELDEQTLTYLFMRNIPRWLIYVVKFLATTLITALMTCIFSVLCLFVIYKFDTSNPAISAEHVVRLIAMQSMSVFAYCSLFGLLSLLVRRTMVLGMIYLIGFEGVLANIDFVARKLTIMYYFRVLSIRWLDQSSAEWNIDLKTAPSVTDCVGNLAGAAIVFTIVGAWIFGHREFRLKTPEGN